MSLIKGLRRRPLIAIATVLAFLVSAGIAVWYPSPLPAKASAEDKQHLQNQLRKGVGSLCNRVSALCGLRKRLLCDLCKRVVVLCLSDYCAIRPPSRQFSPFHVLHNNASLVVQQNVKVFPRTTIRYPPGLLHAIAEQRVYQQQ